MDVTPRPSVTDLKSIASSSQSSLRSRHFQYDVLSEGEIRLFKLDLNGEDEPLSGALMSTYHTWDVTKLARSDWWKSFSREDQEKVMKELTGSKTYDTVSYTWGDQSESHALQLSFISSKLAPGKKVRTNFESYRNGTIQIGSNLRDLLVELRRRKLEHFVWVDAICINQFNDMEKKTQIPMMRAIFEYAGEGYIWLGQGSAGQLKAFKGLEQLTDLMRKAIDNDLDLDPGKSETFTAAQLPEPYESVWWDIGKLMRNDYWNRLWTLQEAVVFDTTSEGRKQWEMPATDVILGTETIKLDVLNRFALAANSLGLRSWIITGRLHARSTTLHAFDGIDEIRTCRESFGRDFWGVSLRALLLGTRRRKATFAADVVYGMLAMMDKHTAQDLVPAANSSIQELFIKFAKHYARNEHSENILNHIATETKLEGLPSWCPNFASSPATLPIGSTWTGKYYTLAEEDKSQAYHAGFTVDGKWTLPRSRLYYLKGIANVLKGRNEYTGLRDTQDPRQISFLPESDFMLVSGMHLDVVAEVVDCNPAAESLDFCSLDNLVQTEEWDARCLKLALTHLSREFDGFDTYTRTITANRLKIERSHDGDAMFDYQYREDFIDRYRQFKDFIQVMKALNGDVMIEDNLSKEAWHFADVLARVTSRRRFFATEGGRIGLGPADIEPGDAVCVFFYCPTPYIMRHWTTGRSYLVGEAYVHGLMYGEALDMLKRGDIDETKWVVE